MKKSNIFFMFLVFSLISPKIYADGENFNREEKTIRELRQDLEKIEQNENELDLEFKKFLQEYRIDSFLKKGLSLEESSKLKGIARKFKAIDSSLEKKIYSFNDENHIKKYQLLSLKNRKELYRNLIPYINLRNYKDYLTYIEKNTRQAIEKNNLYLEKIRKQNDYNQKVEALREKIQENNRILDKEVRTMIEKRFEQKFDKLMKSEVFSSLSQELKVKTIENLIQKIQEKINVMRVNLNYDSNFIESDLRKIEIYKIATIKFNEFLSELKK